MGMPGQTRWPGFEVRLPAPRRKPPQRTHRERLAAKDRMNNTALQATLSFVHEILPVLPPELRGKRFRPSSFDHPLATAARIGRRDYTATISDLPNPNDPAQIRAFLVARDRSRGIRWGWKTERWMDARGTDNRTHRRKYR